ncbi:hypothetical protein GJ629_08425 [Halapricum sp. CBA1109]|uniref:hypothetical protein n=1 Tax=Halapricum sp. CBA1109 TaxID=2668068 RepID=UPI0012F94933|nr:hypothetical protein [Halapricum sp. CBA1109]MUV89916.1 hypothetical protein [Halapricum sp. CBA1109]
MSHAVHSQQSTATRFTVAEQETDFSDDVVVVRTKRYAFYWLLSDTPVLLSVRDYDGTDVTGTVDPPDGMYERVAQH